MKRTPRNERRNGVNVRLSQRDQFLLRSLARFRIARTTDIVSLVFPTARPDTATKRLRRLFDAKYLDVLLGDRSEENTYTLGTKGREWARSSGIELIRRSRTPIPHDLAVVRTWVNMVLFAHRQSILRLDMFRPDWEIRKHVPHAPLVPDALVQLSRTDTSATLRFAIEVDLGTESLRTIKDKITAYEQHRQAGTFFGWETFGLVFVLARDGIGRRDHITAALTACESWSRVWNESDQPTLTTSPNGKDT